MNRVGSAFERAARHSRLGRLVRSLQHSTVVALFHSFASLFGTALRNSFLYRWLTTEPDPDVIVIDLTETWTVGPIIQAIDRVAGLAAPHWRSSRFRKDSQQLIATVERLVGDSVVCKFLGQLLAPPTETDSAKDKE